MLWQNVSFHFWNTHFFYWVVFKSIFFVFGPSTNENVKKKSFKWDIFVKVKMMNACAFYRPFSYFCLNVISYIFVLKLCFLHISAVLHCPQTKSIMVFWETFLYNWKKSLYGRILNFDLLETANWFGWWKLLIVE